MPDIASLRFLVVDDEEFIQKLAVRILQKMGASEIATASDGAEALNHVDTAENAPDVMLVDLSMPGIGGAQLLRELANRGFGGAVILVSGADEETLTFAQGMAEHRDTRVLGYIIKPLKPEALSEMLAKLD